MSSFTTSLTRIDSKVWSYVLPVSAEQAEPFLELPFRRVLATLNDEVTIHCALMHDGVGGYFININKELRKKLGLEQGTAVQVSLAPDHSKYGMAMPEEFDELLEQDPVFEAHFAKLTPGKQRNLIHLVGKMKHHDTRMTKAIMICEYLKMANGKLDFKALNQFMKEFRI